MFIIIKYIAIGRTWRFDEKEFGFHSVLKEAFETKKDANAYLKNVVKAKYLNGRYYLETTGGEYIFSVVNVNLNKNDKN